MKEFEDEPCASCKHRWPNENEPEMEVGDGCDRPWCEYRPDRESCYEPKGDD